MAAAGVVALELVIDLRRRLKLLLQTVGADQRRRTVHLVKAANLLRDLKKRRAVIQLLPDQLLAEDARELLRLHGLKGAGIQERRRLLLHIGPQIIPCLRHLVFVQIDFVGDFFVFHRRYLHMIFFQTP